MFAMVEGEFINLQKIIKVSRLGNNAFCIIYDSKEHPLDLYRFNTKDEAEDKYRKIIEAIDKTIREAEPPYNPDYRGKRPPITPEKHKKIQKAEKLLRGKASLSAYGVR